MTGAHDAVRDSSDLFRTTLHGNDVQEFDTRWDEILLSMTRIPLDDNLERWYKLRLREWDQLNVVLALHEQEIEQHLSQPSYQMLKTVVKRCKDQKIRARNFEARTKGKAFGKKAKTMLPKESKRTQKETHAVSATMRISVKSTVVHSSPKKQT